MLQLGDSEWKDLIPFVRIWNHIKAGIEKIREDNKRSIKSAASEGSSRENRKYVQVWNIGTHSMINSDSMNHVVFQACAEAVRSEVLDLPDDRDAETPMLTAYSG